MLQKAEDPIPFSTFDACLGSHETGEILNKSISTQETKQNTEELAKTALWGDQLRRPKEGDDKMKGMKKVSGGSAEG